MTDEALDVETALGQNVPLSDGLDDLVPVRLQLGEAWMFCTDCGAKLFSFDGDKDASKRCLKVQRYGRCE